MALIEEVEDSGESARVVADARSKLHYLVTLLTLPRDLLPEHANEDKDPQATATFRNHALDSLRELLRICDTAGLGEWPVTEQGDIFAQISRLYGQDDWTSGEIMQSIDDIANRANGRDISLHLLRNTLRPLFSFSHPMLHPDTSRALPRPAGGPEAMSDLQDESTQAWKSYAGWGSYNILAFCCTHLPDADIPEHIGLLLPPTLMMLDDWEQAWRGRAVWVLSKWIGKVPADTMRRMGIDKLLIKSLLHTLSLHPNPPLPHVLPLALDLIDRTTRGEQRADLLAEVMDKAILTGWLYAPSGPEGRAVLTQIARDLERMCEVIGWGILRWMKSIIPNLLQPLSFPPTPPIIPHFEANLSALLAVLRVVEPTGRVPRWRGQILDVMARVCVHLDEKEREEAAVSENDTRPSSSRYDGIRTMVTQVLNALVRACSGIETNEFKRLLDLDKAVFGGPISSCSRITGHA